MNVLVINCGSSSIKYKLVCLDPDRESAEVLASGLAERVGNDGAKLTHRSSGKPELVLDEPIPDHRRGIEKLLDVLVHPEYGAVESLKEIHAVGHRVVHAGEHYTGSVRITEDVIRALEECIDLAPLHNPPNLAGIAACRACMPDIPHVAVFDNALHHTVPPRAYTYALPYELCEKHGVRRYGFHGIAFRSALARAEEFLGVRIEKLRIISMMLGSGCTINAMKYGRSIDVSTGFTPLEGLIQSTRTGDIDAAAVLYIMEREGLTPGEMTEILNRKSGWLGISGVSQDLRDLFDARAQGNSRAALAIDAIAYRLRKYLGAYAAAMGGVDLVIVTGGVGQNAPEIRARALRCLEFMGIHLDAERNRVVSQDAVISTDNSPVKVITVVLDEELVIARDTAAIARQETEVASHE